jgi:hypothetical protein
MLLDETCSTMCTTIEAIRSAALNNQLTFRVALRFPRTIDLSKSFIFSPQLLRWTLQKFRDHTKTPSEQTRPSSEPQT